MRNVLKKMIGVKFHFTSYHVWSTITQKLIIAQKTHWYKNSDQKNARASFIYFKRTWGKNTKKMFDTKITISDYISKTKNCTKKIIYARNECQVNSNIHCKFGIFWRKFIFFVAESTHYGRRPWRPNAIWCGRKFLAHHFF